MRLRPAWIGVVLGAAGFAGGLAAAFAGMRDVMRTTGGSCASGGPYQIRAVCPKDDTELLLFGILGVVVAGIAVAGFVARCGGSVLGASLVMWAALFGALGFNFLQLGINPPPHQGSASGWVLIGGLFELMALGGLVPAVGLLVGWLRHPADHGKPVFDYSGVVMASPPTQER